MESAWEVIPSRLRLLRRGLSGEVISFARLVNIYVTRQVNSISHIEEA